MKQNRRSHGGALDGVFVLLRPIFFPSPFVPLSHASPSLFSIYGGEARISALRKSFPLMEDKKSLAPAGERARIKGKASLLAAVDYYVSMHSDIFISASPVNMHNAMVGHRTYENLETIRPNMALLG